MRRLALAVLFAGGFAMPVRGEDGGDVNAATAAAVQSLQQRILADPQLADGVAALRDNPQVQAILADPAVAAALARGDLATLLTDPRVRRLADDPAVQNLTRQVGR